jgi:hypothetical protein
MTKLEQQWQRAVREFGCICCFIDWRLRSDCDIHHMLSGGRKMGERFVLGICPSHHRFGFDGRVTPGNPMGIVSRHHNLRAFEKRYGTEESLRMKTAELIGWKEMEWLTQPHQ